MCIKKLFFFLFITCNIIPGIYSMQLEDLIDPVYITQLRSGNSSITETQLKNPIVKLQPRYLPLRQFVDEAFKSLDPNVMVETLYLYKKPVSTGNWNHEQRSGLFNQLLALSTMTGIQYYSASRKTMRTFFESSIVIDGPDSKRPVPDPVYNIPPQSLTLYTRQKDLTFGENIYRYDYRTTDSAFFFMQENLTVMNAGIIPAIGKNKLRSVMAVINCDDSLLIYAVSMARVTSVLGMGDRISSSFSNRAEAILKWFTTGADKL